jgi:hypothetical protein
VELADAEKIRIQPAGIVGGVGRVRQVSSLIPWAHAYTQLTPDIEWIRHERMFYAVASEHPNLFHIRCNWLFHKLKKVIC